MEKKKVSVIIPLYNGSKFIEDTINSCVTQTYSDIELILLDDCSTDDGFERARKIVDRLNNPEKYKCLKNAENLGVLKTCNRGAQMATGDCLLFLGHDDILPPDYLSAIMEEYDDSIAFIFSSPKYIDEKGEVIAEHSTENVAKYANNHILKYSLTKECIIQSTGLIINTTCFNEVGGFDIRRKNYGEWNLWIKLLVCGNAKYSDKVHAFYRRHSTNMTNSFGNRRKRKELVAYWNECRRLAISKFDLSLIEKIKSYGYYIYTNLYEIVYMMLKSEG